MNMFKEFVNIATNHNEEITAARNLAQVRLAQDIEVDLGVWIDMGYAKKFDDVTKANPTILEDLTDEDKFEDTLAEIKTKIYH